MNDIALKFLDVQWGRAKKALRRTVATKAFPDTKRVLMTTTTTTGMMNQT